MRRRSNRPRAKFKKLESNPRPLRSKNSLNFKSLFRLMLILSALAVITWLPFTKIECQTQLGTDCLFEDEYRAYLNNSLSGKIRSSLLIDKSGLSQALAGNNFVEKASLDQLPVFWLRANIVERSASARWSSATSRDDIYLIDRYGFLISSASQFPDIDIEPLFIDQIITQPDQTDSLLTPQLIRFSNELLLADFPYDISYFEIDDNPRELTVVLSRPRVVSIKMTLMRSAKEQVMDAELAIAHLMEQGSSFGYIDVRLASGTAYR